MLTKLFCFREIRFFVWKIEKLTSSNYHRAPITTVFCWNFAHVSYLAISTKGCSRFFWFCLDLELLAKIKKTWCLYTLVFYIFINDSRSKQNLKNPEHPFVEIIKWKTYTIFHQKILNFVVVGASQSFPFFREIAWFFGNNRALSKFRYRILYNWISITEL